MTDEFDLVVPDEITQNPDAKVIFEYAILDALDAYTRLRKLGIPPNICGTVLPPALADIFVDE